MATKSKASKKKSGKSRVKKLNIKPETIRDLSGSEKKKIKGGGALPGSVLMGSNRL